MADKGGKGYPLAAKGKAVVSKRAAIPVEIDSDSDSEDSIEELTPISLKSNGKSSSDIKSSTAKVSTEIPKASGKDSSKGQLGKGGKASSAGKGGAKGSLPGGKKPSKSDAELKLDIDIPKKSRLLMNCEVAEILQEIHEHMAILSEDPKIKIPESFDKAFQYAKEGNHFDNSKFVRQALEPLKNCGVNDGEMCLIANICPETVEELYALIPSLKANKDKNGEPIKEVLSGLAKLKRS